MSCQRLKNFGENILAYLQAFNMRREINMQRFHPVYFLTVSILVCDHKKHSTCNYLFIYIICPWLMWNTNVERTSYRYSCDGLRESHCYYALERNPDFWLQSHFVMNSIRDPLFPNPIKIENPDNQYKNFGFFVSLYIWYHEPSS